MTRKPKDVTDAELAVLGVLWERGPATIREIRKRLYPEGGTSEYATVQKLLERLEEKGWVGRERRAGPHLFRPRLDRDALIGRRLESLMEKLCGGSATPLLTHLVRRGEVTPEEVEELRGLIDELDRERRGRRRGQDPKA